MSTEQALAPTPEIAAPPPAEVEHHDAPEAVDGSEVDSAPASDPALETRARDMGWVPLTEFRGDPAKWRPADEFVQRGEEVLPIVRANLDKERKRVRDLEDRIKQQGAAYEERLSRIDRASQAALRHQLTQIHESYEAAKRKAVEEGDTERYDRLQSAHVDAIGRFKEETAPPPPQRPAEPEVPRDVQDKISTWVDRQSSWWNKEPAMSDMAVALFGRLPNDMPVEERLDEVERRLTMAFPEKMPQKARASAAPAVEGGSRQPAGASTPKGKGWADMPADDRKAAERFLTRDGLFLPKGVTKESATDADWAKARAAYAKEYWTD